MANNWCVIPREPKQCGKVSYVVPMSAPSSVATTMAMENSNMNYIKDAPSADNKLLTSTILYTMNKASKAAEMAAFGGMSLWFLVVAVLLCVILFGGVRV